MGGGSHLKKYYLSIYIYIPYYIYIYQEPEWPLFLKVNPLKQGLNSYQNKGPHLGSRYVHMQNICLACPNSKNIDANFVDIESNFQVNLNQQSFATNLPIKAVKTSGVLSCPSNLRDAPIWLICQTWKAKLASGFNPFEKY